MMAKTKGQIRKMQVQVDDSGNISYSLPLGEEKIELNPLVGKKIKFKFSGDIYCIDTGKRISKTYNNGYSYESFLKLAACDVCIVQPEKCHYHLGTCREPLWGESECFQPHYVYLALTSGLKVGITRSSQIPNRWVDQGAKYALPILKVKNRYVAGQIEDAIKGDFNDKTHWKRMLSAEPEFEDLLKVQKEIVKKFKKIIEENDAEILESEILELHFPINERPEKFKSVGFDKESEVSGVLKGIKGQYLFIDDVVINMRKHQGYEVELSH